MLLILRLPDLSACHPKAEEGKVPSEYAWVSWNLFQSIHSQSPTHISTGPQLPAPSNYLHPSTTWPLPSPMVTPSNVGPHFQSEFFPLPDHALSTLFLMSHDPGRGYDTRESPHAQQRWYRPVSIPPPAHAHRGISRHALTATPHTWLVTSPGRPRISILRRLRNWRSVCSRRFRISSGSSGGNSCSGARRSTVSGVSASASASGLSGGR